MSAVPVTVRTAATSAACALVGAGLGGAVVPEMVARTAATAVGTRLLEPGVPRRTISVVRRIDRPAPTAEAFQALLRGVFGRAAHQGQDN